MRKSIALVFVTTLGLGLAACSSGTAGSASSADTTSAGAGGGATITVWSDSNREAALKDAATKFESETGNKVNIVVKEFNDIRADFLSQVSNGQGPDITVGANDWLGEFAANGAVVPIELGDKASDFNPVATSAFTYDGQVYGLPYAIENTAIIRNTALADSTPSTWDEMIAKGRAAGTKYPFLIQTSDQGDPYTYYALQTSFGAPVFNQNADGSYTTELGMGGDAGTKFAQFLADNGKNGTGVLDTAMTYDIAVGAFSKGESPYILGGPWMISDFQKAGIDVAVDPVPSAGGKDAAPFVGVQGFYVSSASKNSIVASQFLVDYLATEEAQTAIYKAGNRLPALTAAADKAKSDPLTAGFAKAAENAKPMPSIPEMGSVWTPWGVAEAQIIGGADASSTWTKMVGDLTTTISKGATGSSSK